MDIDMLERRVKELGASLERSVANHNYLLGAFDEVKSLLKLMQDAQSERCCVAQGS
jgi:hypothetical protein